jgi:hypothetical protein
MTTVGAEVSGFFPDGWVVWRTLRTKTSWPRRFLDVAVAFAQYAPGDLWVEIGPQHAGEKLDALVFRGLLLGHGRILETCHHDVQFNLSGGLVKIPSASPRPTDNNEPL